MICGVLGGVRRDEKELRTRSELEYTAVYSGGECEKEIHFIWRQCRKFMLGARASAAGQVDQ